MNEMNATEQAATAAPEPSLLVGGPEDLPKGTELERAALGLLHDVMVSAWVTRDRAGAAGFTRAFQAGFCDAFDVLAFDAGSVEAARDAVDWALGRMNAILSALSAERTLPPEWP